VLDYSGIWFAPGLVDTHLHGFGGADVMDNDWEGVVKTMSEGLTSCGVTSFLPTTLTADHKLLKDVSKGIGEHYKEAKGAKIQGIYFEGPYFTEEHKGAQNPIYMGNPSIEEFEEWQEASGGIIKKIALAPERDNVRGFVEHVTAEGVVVAMGHSNATLEEAQKAADAGASVWVHAYNGMRGLNHREPGMVGAVLSVKNTYAELICDGHHVHPKACEILMNEIGRDHVAMITDCMRAGGMPEGHYMLGEFDVTVKDGTARLAEGNLAGSILRLDEGVRNVVDWQLATVEEAIRMASLVPAISCKMDDVCGQIKEGRMADFIVLTPSLDLEATYVDGTKVYEA
jgi:N-acetylglucosamine-6-phosphate deacetylase